MTDTVHFNRTHAEQSAKGEGFTETKKEGLVGEEGLRQSHAANDLGQGCGFLAPLENKEIFRRNPHLFARFATGIGSRPSRGVFQAHQGA